jgi:hypothetical protein
MFELIFLLTCVALVIGILACLVSLVRGRKDRARRWLRLLVAVAGAYLMIVVLSSLVIPRQEFSLGEPRCLDDWCITVTSARWIDAAPSQRYVAGISLTNQARRTPMGEKGTVGFLIDASKRRYDPIPMPTDIPYDTKVQPGQTLKTSRTFEVPREAQGLGFVYTHQGGFPIDWFIVGGGGWFQGPPVVRLQR